MPVSFNGIIRGREYSRNQLAKIWGYASYHAIARGVVTPQGTNKIILFVTQEKQDSLEPYADRLIGNVLHWEGPNDHYAEQRMVSAHRRGEEIHLFYRIRHHMDFTYMGAISVIDKNLHSSRPSEFTFQVG